MQVTPDFTDLIGAPYITHGRGNNGYDCYGLAIEAERRYGKCLKDAYYNDSGIKYHDINTPTLNVRAVPAPAAGVIVELTLGEQDRERLHIGVCVDNKRFIHCTEKRGVHVSMLAAYPAKRFYEVV